MVQLQLLTATVKLFLKQPETSQVRPSLCFALLTSLLLFILSLIHDYLSLTVCMCPTVSP